MNNKKLISGIIILNLLVIGVFTVNYLFGKDDNYVGPINKKVYTIVTENEDIEGKNIIEKDEKKISWSDDIKFTYCDSVSNYKLDKRNLFFQKKDIILLKQKVFNVHSTMEYKFSDYIFEYCKTEDNNKFILWSGNTYNIAIIGIYDKELDIYEVADLKSIAFDKIIHYFAIRDRDYGKNTLNKYYDSYIKDKNNLRGFGKREGNVIPFISYGVSITGTAEGKSSSGGKYLSNSNFNYCNKGLTLEGNLSVCFADVYYSYDFITNTIYEDKICSYYFDDNGKINVLQKCYVNKWLDKGYNLISKADGIGLYQDNIGDISIIDVDLDRANVSFGGVDQVNKKLIHQGSGEGFINKAFRGNFTRYDLVEESSDTELYNFNKSNTSETFGNFSYIGERKNGQYLFAAVNGQFFNANKNPTFLSFPVKSNGKILSSYVDNQIPKRTIIIDENNKVKIIEGYKKEDLNDVSNKELLVAFPPDVKARKNAKIGRSYIGIIGDNNIIFFIAKNKSQYDMNKIISDYGVKKEDIIMLDGGPSAQFIYYEGMEVNDFYGEWGVPHYFMIYSD